MIRIASNVKSSSNLSAMFPHDPAIDAMDRITIRIRHCLEIQSSSTVAFCAIFKRLVDLEAERAEEGNDPSTYEYYVWRRTELEREFQKHLAISTKMFEVLDDLYEELREVPTSY